MKFSQSFTALPFFALATAIVGWTALSTPSPSSAHAPAREPSALPTPSPAASTGSFKYSFGGRNTEIFALDSSRAWITADGGRIRFTPDGGCTWVLQETADAARESLRGIHVRGGFGMAVGFGGRVLLASDPQSIASGVVWEEANISPMVSSLDRSDELRDVYFVDGTHGWIVGNKTFKKVVRMPGTPDTFMVEDVLLEAGISLDQIELFRIDFIKTAPGEFLGLAVGAEGSIFRAGPFKPSDPTKPTWMRVLHVPARPCFHDDCDSQVGEKFPYCPGWGFFGGPGTPIDCWDVSFVPGDPRTAIVVAGWGQKQGYVFATDDAGVTWNQEFHECEDHNNPSIDCEQDGINWVNNMKCGTMFEKAPCKCQLIASATDCNVLPDSGCVTTNCYNGADTVYKDCSCSHDSFVSLFAVGAFSSGRAITTSYQGQFVVRDPLVTPPIWRDHSFVYDYADPTAPVNTCTMGVWSRNPILGVDCVEGDPSLCGTCMQDPEGHPNEIGWAAGRSNLIEKSNNGGECWRTQGGSYPHRGLTKVFTMDVNRAWAVAKSGYGIFGTADGGLTWVLQKEKKNGGLTLHDIAFDSEFLASGVRGVAVGDRQDNGNQKATRLYRTVDGQNWTRVLVGSPGMGLDPAAECKNLKAVASNAASEFWAVGSGQVNASVCTGASHSLVLRSLNAGEDWTEVTSISDTQGRSLDDIEFFTTDEAFLMGRESGEEKIWCLVDATTAPVLTVINTTTSSTIVDLEDLHVVGLEEDGNLATYPDRVIAYAVGQKLEAGEKRGIVLFFDDDPVTGTGGEFVEDLTIPLLEKCAGQNLNSDPSDHSFWSVQIVVRPSIPDEYQVFIGDECGRILRKCGQAGSWEQPKSHTSVPLTGLSIRFGFPDGFYGFAVGAGSNVMIATRYEDPLFP